MTTNSQSHAQGEPVAQGEVEFYPPHPPREDTPEYKATHELLIKKLNKPCFVCGVQDTTLKDPVINVFKATQLETHHSPVQRELADAVDWKKVALDFPSITSRVDFIRWIDSPANMLVLCDVHHRSSDRGIHHLVVADWNVQKYLLDGYVLNASSKNEQTDLQQDDKIVQQDISESERT